MRITSIVIFFSALIFWSCDKAVVLDLDQMSPKIVIEGLVSDQPGYQFVKVSRTVDFYESGATPRVSNAFIFVSDDLGNEFPFVHNPHNHADSTGYYLPAAPFVGAPGRTYHLSVTVDGELYQAEDKMYRITEIDSLQYQINEEEQEDPKEEGKFYELLLYAKEPQETSDYYLFKFFRNDSLKI